MVLAEREVGRGVIAGIGQHHPGHAHGRGGRFQMLRGRSDLPLVVDGIADMRRDNQMAVIVDHRLGIVGLLETVGRLHDPRLGVGQVHLILRSGSRLEW